MVKSLVDEQGLRGISDVIPYTPERIQGMLDLLKTDINDLTVPPAAPPPGAEGSGEKKDEFKSFDPATMKFDHQCPRCGFQFNEKRGSGDEDEGEEELSSGSTGSSSCCCPLRKTD